MNRLQLLLLQGGLGNQLLQCCLFSSLTNTTLRDLPICTQLLRSRLRRLRFVTQRSPSLLIFQNQKVHLSTAKLLLLRLFLRCSPLGQYLCDGALKMVSIGKSQYFNGDGLTTFCFDSEHDPFWLSVLCALDEIYGSVLLGPSLAVHIRREDFYFVKTTLTTGLYPLPLEYYQIALSSFGIFPFSNQTIRVCTDSPKEARQLLESYYPSIIIDAESSPEKDLWFLSHASYIVISNSSFSAVGAHLSQLRNKYSNIIAPKNWFSSPRFYKSRVDIRKDSWTLY